MSVNYFGKTSNSASVKTYYSNIGLNNILWSTSKIIDDSSLNQNVIVPASPYYSNLYIPGDLYLDGNFINSSDINLKTNIECITDEKIDKALKIKTYSYNFKNDINDKKHYGVTPQEIEEDFPELVISKPYNDELCKGVNYLEMVPLLLNIVQKQQQQINILENKLNDIFNNNNKTKYNLKIDNDNNIKKII